jgi:hypothetical protein
MLHLRDHAIDDTSFGSLPSVLFFEGLALGIWVG